MAQCGARSVRFAKLAKRQFAPSATQAQFPNPVYCDKRTFSSGFEDFIMECENGFEVSGHIYLFPIRDLYIPATVTGLDRIGSGG